MTAAGERAGERVVQIAVVRSSLTDSPWLYALKLNGEIWRYNRYEDEWFIYPPIPRKK